MCGEAVLLQNHAMERECHYGRVGCQVVQAGGRFGVFVVKVTCLGDETGMHWSLYACTVCRMCCCACCIPQVAELKVSSGLAGKC